MDPKAKELDDFKRINLSEFAAAHGYVLDRKASSRNSAVMRHDDGDKIIIAMGDDHHYVYFSVRDPSDHGTIIDFVQHRRSLTLGQVRQALRPWLGKDVNGLVAPPRRPTPSSYVSKLTPTTTDLAGVRARYEGMRPVEKHHDYLVNERAIPNTVLASARFRGCIRTDDRGNAIFPHFDDDGLCGYEIKNRGFTGFASGGQKGLWSSNSTPHDDAIAISEAPIDALSYAVLRKCNRIRFLSIAGQMNSEQPGLLASEMKALPSGGRVVIAFDNDAGGDALAAQVTRIHCELGRTDISIVIDRPLSPDTDWNDVLRALRQPGPSGSFPILS